jgi:CRISPR-associated protein (TIGR03986 family)
VAHSAVVCDDQLAEERFVSGELQCTLTALTPLIAGSFQMEYQYLDESVRQAFTGLLSARHASSKVDDTKKLIEPMRLGPASGTLPGRILIPGEALKGPIAQSLKALLSAPMERVQERTLSFRPNLGDAKRIRPAVVHSCRYDKGGLEEIRIELCEDSQGRACTCDDIIYVYRDAVPVLQAWIADNYDRAAKQGLHRLRPKAPRADINDTLFGVRIEGRSYAKKLAKSQNGSEDLSDYVVVRYLEGQDGTSTFHQAFNGRHGYEWALVKVNHSIDPKDIQLVTIPKSVVRDYAATLHHLADGQHGHLLHHPNRKKLQDVPENIRQFQKNQWPLAGDLLYVEFDRDPLDQGAKIIGIGHHFRHRRIYRDSIHLTGDSRKTPQERLREILCPLKLERESQPDGTYAGSPQKLTAARGLFGYVAPQANGYEKPDEPLTFGIGQAHSDFKQLAGRVSINWAVECGDPNRKGRFLNEGQYGCLVPLRPLSSPKPSAVETYLTQDKLNLRTDGGTLCTYGDTLDDASAGELNGRKTYLHQPDAARSPDRYELTGPGHRDWWLGEGDNRKQAILSEQAGVARFVSAPQTEFKFTLRVRDLRTWELGALWLALAPDRSLIEHFLQRLGANAAQTPKLQTWLRRAQESWKPDDQQRPLLALKVGHGRPLGLGSVRVKIKAMRRLKFDEQMAPTLNCQDTPDQLDEQRKSAVSALAAKIVRDFTPAQVVQWIEFVFVPWLQVHRYAGRTRFDYPRGEDGRASTGPVYEFHSRQRQNHAKGRKRPREGKPLSPGGLISLDKLDTKESGDAH